MLAWPPGTRSCMRAPQTAVYRSVTRCGHHALPAGSFPGVGPYPSIQLGECSRQGGQKFPESTLLWVVEMVLGMPRNRGPTPPLWRHSDDQSGRREDLPHCTLLGSDPMWVALLGSQLHPGCVCFIVT